MAESQLGAAPSAPTDIATVGYVTSAIGVAEAGDVTPGGVQTLTNKTIDLGSNTVTMTAAQLNTAVTDADVATLTGAETLTNKTISLASNTVTMTAAQLNTAVTDADVATLTGAETLSNKTFTAPALGTPASGDLSNCTTTVVKPASNSTTALKITKADGATNILNVDTTNSRLGVLSTTPTHTLHVGSTGNGIAVYNTSDETTNYERLRIGVTSNVFKIDSETGGTGTQRNIALTGKAVLTMVGSAVQGPTLGTINMTLSSGTASATVLGITGALNAASGLQYGLSISPTFTQSSTAGYTALLINPTESATGSGVKNLADFQVGGSSKWRVDNTGKVTLNNGPTISSGTGTPEGAVTAPVGSIFMRTDGGTSTSHYIKESGAGNTGWIAK